VLLLSADHRAFSQILAGFVGTVALTASKAALAIGETPVDLIDDRSAKGRGFDIIYEARDLSLNQNMRDGLTQARADLDFTTNRVAESKRRIDADLEPLVQKAYW
jgi:photosystem II oxygen-evolving enhancer protein 3